MRLRFALLLTALLIALPAQAETEDEAAVRTLIAVWYGEMRKRASARPTKYLAPGAMLLPEDCPDTCPPLKRSADLRPLLGARYLAARAREFDYEIERLRVERTLARADVWERGFDYAWALKKTTQSAAAAIFVLEKREGEGWKVLVYQSLVRAIRPQDKDAPLPDLSPKD